MKKDRVQKRVYVASPLRGQVDPNPEVQAINQTRNIAVAGMLCLFAARDGVAPFAPHLLYPLFLDDTVPAERTMGINAGISFLEACAELWVYTGLGVSEGMKAEIDIAHAMGKRIIYDPPCWQGI